MQEPIERIFIWERSILALTPAMRRVWKLIFISHKFTHETFSPCTGTRNEKGMETEKEWAGNGTVLMKFWLHIDRDEQLKRFVAREFNPFKNDKITDEGWRNRGKWDNTWPQRTRWSRARAPPTRRGRLCRRPAGPRSSSRRTVSPLPAKRFSGSPAPDAHVPAGRYLRSMPAHGDEQ